MNRAEHGQVHNGRMPTIIWCWINNVWASQAMVGYDHGCLPSDSVSQYSAQVRKEAGGNKA